jgi:hypothetical protein
MDLLVAVEAVLEARQFVSGSFDYSRVLVKQPSCGS